MDRERRTLLPVLFAITVIVGWTGSVSAGTAEEELMATLDQLKAVFEKQALSQKEKTKQAQELVLAKLDFIKASSSILGKHLDEHRSRLSEFTDVFRRLIKHTFLNNIHRVQGIIEVVVVSSGLYGDIAEVIVSFTLGEEKHEVLFSLHMAGGRWMVYNFSEGGIGLIGLYRTQVDKILKTRSFDEMLGEFEKKAASR